MIKIEGIGAMGPIVMPLDALTGRAFGRPMTSPRVSIKSYSARLMVGGLTQRHQRTLTGCRHFDNFGIMKV
jgi:hypothetical protein